MRHLELTPGARGNNRCAQIRWRERLAISQRLRASVDMARLRMAQQQLVFNLVIIAGLVLAACDSSRAARPRADGIHATAAIAAPRPSTQVLTSPTAPPATTPPADAVLVGAGDIADCDSGGADATARLLDRIDGTVFTLGDNAYPSGTADQIRRCYAPTWGRHKGRTRPAPGNHDYGSKDAAPYFAYFGENAGPANRGYYSYNLGAWHIISLNSETAAGPSSRQAGWLRADLAANPRTCTLAYWHTVIFSSGAVHGNNDKMKPIWDILASAGADVIVTAHEHMYERFAPQTSSGKADPNGIREFVVGTGGGSHYAIGAIQPNSEVRNNDTFGVLKLTLRATSYAWEFVPIEGGQFQDAGSVECVGSAKAP